MSATNSSNGGPLKKKSSARDPAFLRRINLTAAPPHCHCEPACAGRRSEESALSFFADSHQPTRLGQAIFALFFALTIAALSALAQTSHASFPGPEPANIAQDFISKTGDFGNQAETDVVILLERSRHLYLRDSAGIEHLLNPLAFSKEREQTSFTYASNEADPWVLAFKQRKTEPIWEIFTQIGPYHRLPYSVPGGNIKVVKPTRSLEEIRTEALAARPPEEKGSYRNSDLVELAKLDPAIHLDIRYATPNDFLGKAVYTQARAFLQRPAAEALVRALHRLQPYGFGLLIHDGYRPWYVTKIFWEATPPEGKIFVADPAQGSRHNRGCAVDLTLYDLKTDEPVEMTGLYDEMSPRSFPNYPGGTSLQRWHRDLLRWAMESEGFTVYENEWWHFDYKDWREYAIGNVPFEKLDAAKN
jgi:D-alanyl-D-alanine dipeptidase